MKTLEELKTELETLKAGGLVEDILALVESEKSKGIDLHRKQNAENQKLRNFKKAMEALGYDPDNDDLDEFTSKMIEGKNQSGSKDSLTLKSLNEKITQLTKERDLEKQKSQEYLKKAKSKTLSAKLMETISDKFYGPDLLIKSLITDGVVDLDDDDNVVFKNGENIMSLKEGVNQLLVDRKDIVKSNQNGGAGTKVNPNYQNTQVETILKSNDKDAIKANLPELAKSMGIKL